MAHGAQRVALPDARQTERQDIRGVVEDIAVGELVESPHERRRQAPFIKGGERFPRRQLRGPAQARDATLVSLLRFELQDLEEQGQGRLLLRLDEARDHLARGRREGEAREQRRDLIADSACRGGAAHAAAPARSES